MLGQSAKEFYGKEGRTAENIRAYYDEKLRSLGLIHIARRCVRVVANNSPLYDVVLASRKDTAVKLWEKANPEPKNEQLWFGRDHG